MAPSPQEETALAVGSQEGGRRPPGDTCVWRTERAPAKTDPPDVGEPATLRAAGGAGGRPLPVTDGSCPDSPNRLGSLGISVLQTLRSEGRKGAPGVESRLVVSPLGGLGPRLPRLLSGAVSL